VLAVSERQIRQQLGKKMMHCFLLSPISKERKLHCLARIVINKLEKGCKKGQASEEFVLLCGFFPLKTTFTLLPSFLNDIIKDV